MQIYYPGSQVKVIHTPDAEASQGEAEAQCDLACACQLDALIKRFADRGRLGTSDQFVHEGDEIWAIKTRSGLRAYGWYHRTQQGTFYISHYAYIPTKRQPMLPDDVERVNRNRKIFDPGDKG